jgi:hypothetical protein
MAFLFSFDFDSPELILRSAVRRDLMRSLGPIIDEAGLLVAIAIVFVGCKKPTEVYVECTGDIGGITCTAEHRQGAKPVHVTWDVLLHCRNGIKPVATASLNVEPSAKVGRLIPWTDVRYWQECDQVATIEVSNIRLRPTK